jgi:hypothetical protein
MEANGLLHVPAALSSGNSPPYTLDRRLGELQRRSGRGIEEEKSLPAFEPWSSGRPSRRLVILRNKLSSWATGWTIGVLGFDSQREVGIFLFTTASRTALGPTQPPIQWVSGALSLGVKRPGREADHSPPSSTEVKNAWNYISTPQYAFMAWCSVKKEAQGHLYLYLYRL